MFEFSRRKQRKSRKQHVCDVCKKPILAGREYVEEKLRADGKHTLLRRHIHCDALLTEYLSYYTLNENTVDDLGEWLKERCKWLHRDGVCPDDVYYDECNKACCYECWLIQNEVLPKNVLGAAKQSVAENAEE